MRRAALANHMDEKEIKDHMKASKDRSQFQRWQTIFLTVKGLPADIVAEYVGTTKGTVHQWVYQYNHQGPDGFFLHGRGGRRFGLLSLDEEHAFLDKMRTAAGSGRILTAFAIQATLEEKVGRPVSEDYLYDLLHRHGWRKVMPRPRHPKADTAQQEDFKKNFRSWWQPPRTSAAQKIHDR